jgi:phage N-6-adenine-methyltransferase
MANDLWRTPPEIFEYYNSKYDFKCDVTASKENAMCDLFITEKMDFLTTSLNDLGIKAGSYVWCNPPYSKPLPFVKKCIQESTLSGIGSLMLLNHDMSVEWSSLLASCGCKLDVYTASGSKLDKTYRNGRIAFLDADGNPIKTNNKSQFSAIIPPFVSFENQAATRNIPLTQVMREGVELLENKQVQLSKVA